MADFKKSLTKLADTVVADAMKPGVSLEIRIQALKAATPIYLGDNRIKAQLQIKGIYDDDEAPQNVTDFRVIRETVRQAGK